MAPLGRALVALFTSARLHPVRHDYAAGVPLRHLRPQVGGPLTLPVGMLVRTPAFRWEGPHAPR